MSDSRPPAAPPPRQILARILASLAAGGGATLAPLLAYVILKLYLAGQYDRGVSFVVFGGGLGTIVALFALLRPRRTDPGGRP